MAQDVTSIYNLALSNAGINVTVSNPAERSPEAEKCRLHYDTVRDYVFGMAHWPELKAYSRLALTSTRNENVDWVNTDPEPGYKYAYAFPSDCVHPRHLSDYSRFTTGTDGSTRQIFTNEEKAILFYSARKTDPSLWSNSLYTAVHTALSAAIVAQLTGKNTRVKLLNERANSTIAAVRAVSAREDQQVMTSIPTWISARGYTDANRTRYIYPMNELLINVGVPVK
jgi:hypothetical protein